MTTEIAGHPFGWPARIGRAAGPGQPRGTSVHVPTDPVGRLLFNVLAMVAEFGADLIRARTHEGMRVGKAKGRLRGSNPSSARCKKPTSSSSIAPGEHTVGELEELFGVTARRCTAPSGAPATAPAQPRTLP